MTREEFKKLYGLPECAKEGTGIRVFHKVDSVYNLRNYTQLGELAENTDGWAYKVSFAKVDKNQVKKKLESSKNKLIRYMLENYKDAFDIVLLPCGNGEVVIHYDVYAVFNVPFEYIYFAPGPSYKRKVFIFVPEGIFTIKMPPFNLSGTRPIGAVFTTDALEITLN